MKAGDVRQPDQQLSYTYSKILGAGNLGPLYPDKRDQQETSSQKNGYSFCSARKKALQLCSLANMSRPRIQSLSD